MLPADYVSVIKRLVTPSRMTSPSDVLSAGNLII